MSTLARSRAFFCLAVAAAARSRPTVTTASLAVRASVCVQTIARRRALSTAGGDGEPADPADAARKRERDLIKRQLQRGVLTDYFQMDDAKRRVATAPLEASDVFALPAIKMERLDEVGGTVDVLTRLPGRLTLLTLSFNEFARLQALRWSAPVVALAAARPGALQVLNLNVMDGWRFALLRYFLVRALRRATPPERLADTGVLFASNTEVLCDDMRVHNKVIAYAFLVDEGGTVRWSGHAEPTPEELTALADIAAKTAPP